MTWLAQLSLYLKQVMSVTRLGDFQMFLVANFLTQVDEIPISRMSLYEENCCVYFWQLSFVKAHSD